VITKETRYTRSKKVAGSDLSPGQWIDLPDRIGACAIKSVEIRGSDPHSEYRWIMFWYDRPEDAVRIRIDEKHVIVDPNSAVEQGESWPSWFRLLLSTLAGR
jgi:hypothetical protein